MARPPQPTDFDYLQRARYYAERSGIKTFSTGCVIVNFDGSVVSEGWSHYSQLRLANYRSIHAEVHAILRCERKAWLNGATAYIVTIRNKSGNIGLAKPCGQCAVYLHQVGVRNVVFTTGVASNYERLALV